MWPRRFFDAAMLLDFFKLLQLTLAELARRGWRWFERELPFTASVLCLPAMLAEAGCARRMEIMVRRLDAMGRKIDLVRKQLRSGLCIASIEEDAHFRRMLAVVKADMRALQCEAAAWQCDHSVREPGARLGAALAAVARMSEHIYKLADELLWELGERERGQGGAALS